MVVPMEFSVLLVFLLTSHPLCGSLICVFLEDTYPSLIENSLFIYLKKERKFSLLPNEISFSIEKLANIFS
jgi:hypothetical protein